MTGEERKTIFLNERFMALLCVFIVVVSLIPLIFFRGGVGLFTMFELLVMMAITVALYFAFRFYKWDVAKGLMGGALFCLMYQDAYLVLGELWVEESFDTYLAAGIQGSLYLSSAGMSLLMTVIIAINHFFITYELRGNTKNVIFNQTAIVFKLAVYVMLLAANSRLWFPAADLWINACQFLADIAILLLLVCVETHFDTFKVLRSELLAAKRQKEVANQ